MMFAVSTTVWVDGRVMEAGVDDVVRDGVYCVTVKNMGASKNSGLLRQSVPAP